MSVRHHCAVLCFIVAVASVLVGGCPKPAGPPPLTPGRSSGAPIAPPAGMPGFSPAATPPRPPSAVSDSKAATAPDAVTTPWRDESGERQAVVSKAMDIEVEKVEDAHDKAVSIVEKSGGFIKDEDMKLSQSGTNTGHILARVPTDRVDGVVAQLRELGKVLRLVGRSEDVTKEYTSQGSDIREHGASEDELVAKYEKETNPDRKQELYRQIQANRQANHVQKGSLTDLSEKTHFALIDLTLVEQASPGAFFVRSLGGAGTAIKWLGATAVFWLPFVIVGWLIWRWGKRQR